MRRPQIQLCSGICKSRNRRLRIFILVIKWRLWLTFVETLLELVKTMVDCLIQFLVLRDVVQTHELFSSVYLGCLLVGVVAKHCLISRFFLLSLTSIDTAHAIYQILNVNGFDLFQGPLLGRDAQQTFVNHFGRGCRWTIQTMEVALLIVILNTRLDLQRFHGIQECFSL